jgi:hypothetical protein
VSSRSGSRRKSRENQEWLLPCPICQKRPPRRYCPAKAEDICAVCCGTEREVSIDCPADCPYLVASRQYNRERRDIDWSQIPFADTKIPSSFVPAHEKLLLAISYAVCLHARDERLTVDSDVLASLQALAETYKTLESGIYYEKPPEFRLQRELYDKLKATIDEFKKNEAQQMNSASVRDGEVRDALIFLTQLGATRTNGRPKGRAYLDFLRTQFKSEELSKPASNVVILP